MRVKTSSSITVRGLAGSAMLARPTTGVIVGVSGAHAEQTAAAVVCRRDDGRCGS